MQNSSQSFGSRVAGAAGRMRSHTQWQSVLLGLRLSCPGHGQEGTVQSVAWTWWPHSHTVLGHSHKLRCDEGRCHLRQQHSHQGKAPSHIASASSSVKWVTLPPPHLGGFKNRTRRCQECKGWPWTVSAVPARCHLSFCELSPSLFLCF